MQNFKTLSTLHPTMLMLGSVLVLGLICPTAVTAQDVEPNLTSQLVELQDRVARLEATLKQNSNDTSEQSHPESTPKDAARASEASEQDMGDGDGMDKGMGMMGQGGQGMDGSKGMGMMGQGGQGMGGGKGMGMMGQGGQGMGGGKGMGMMGQGGQGMGSSGMDMEGGEAEMGGEAGYQLKTELKIIKLKMKMMEMKLMELELEMKLMEAK